MPSGRDGVLAGGLLALSLWRLGPGGVLNGLLAAQTALAAILLMVRRAPAREGRWTMRALAWWSAYLPLLMQPGAATAIPLALQVSGLGLALWAKGCLGRSFGVAPADRGLVASGPYRWLRHPAYAGELLNFTGVLASAPTIWNAALLIIVGVSLIVRIVMEEQVIGGYRAYAGRVRWRLLPGVW